MNHVITKSEKANHKIAQSISDRRTSAYKGVDMLFAWSRRSDCPYIRMFSDMLLKQLAKMPTSELNSYQIQEILNTLKAVTSHAGQEPPECAPINR